MSDLRQQIGRNIASRGESENYQPEAATSVSKIYGAHVFNDSVMRQRLPKDIYKKLKKTMSSQEPLDPNISDMVAIAMKDWALELGATHYTHWFHPLTGSIAEKHDAFLTPDDNGGAIQQFSGSSLTQGEPDASSFPHGGIRATFEARGYTAWDPTSPAFVRKTSTGATLCIPTAFCSYTGEALDKKTPLLRSEACLSKSGARLLKVLGSEATSVGSNAGLEQEYFLIDMEYYNARPDLVATGRTLFGADSYKGQSMDDHYFGTIKSRVLSFMDDSEKELFKLGIPAKTRHNEVAPGQYELAPIFEKANMAVDHNMLIMEVMKEVAAKHKFKILYHEKPFAGLNGSGKHCNWSMTDSLGNNLLEPGKTPHENMQFLVILTAIIRAVDKWAKLLRVSIAHAGNDHRLGANEAPPAIISAYLGDELGRIVEELVAGAESSSAEKQSIHLGSTVLPQLPKDTTDRNRTSPFAFTGNKFEFRALGAAQHVAGPVFFINTIVSESMHFMAERLEKGVAGGADLSDAVDVLVKEVLKKHSRVVFNGDGYAGDWEVEAAKRGLLNLKTTPDALPKMMDEDVLELFESMNVLGRGEVESRYNVKVEAYIGTLSIELDAARDIARNIILPVALKYQNDVAASINESSAAGFVSKVQSALLGKVGALVDQLIEQVTQLDISVEAPFEGDDLAHANHIKDELIPQMGALRATVDELEGLVDDSLWPLPKYREMLLLS